MEHINFIFLFLSWNRIVQNVLQKLGKVGCFVTFWSSAVDGHKLQNAVNCRIVYVCARIAVGTIRSGLCKLEALPQQLYCVLFSKSTVSVCLSVCHCVSSCLLAYKVVVFFVYLQPSRILQGC